MTQSLQPSPDNDYQFPPAPNRATLDRAVWAAVMASIGGRLRELEAQRADLAGVIADLRLFGLERLNVAIEPLIVQTQQRLDGLDADLAVLRGQIDTILSGVVPAGIVAESEARVFVTPEQRAEIAALRQELDATKAADIDPGPMAEGRALRVRRATKAELDAAKVAGELKVGELVLVTDDRALAMALMADDYVYAAPVKATRVQAENGEDDLSFMTALTTRQSIESNRSNIDRHIFTESGIFFKNERDKVYLIEIINGGNGGGVSGLTETPAGGISSFSGIMPSSSIATTRTVLQFTSGGTGGNRGDNAVTGRDGGPGSVAGTGGGGGGGNGNGTGADGGPGGGRGGDKNNPGGDATEVGGGGGGGGGSGRNAANNYTNGGPGGSGGAVAVYLIRAEDCPDEIPVIVGAGGLGAISTATPAQPSGGKGFRGEVRVWRFTA